MPTRLVLILDEKTGLPVWYSIIPGNVLDINTIDTVLSDVAENLDVRIDNLVLDAGYASKALFNNFYSDEYKGKNFTVKMPARRVFPYKELYHQNKKLFSNAKYDFVREKKLKSVE